MTDQFPPLQRQAFEAFASYPWQADGVFQAGLENILQGLPADTDCETLTKTELENRQLLRAKHFFFTRFRQKFDLDDYLLYEKQKNVVVEESAAVKAYRRLEVYDFDNDSKFLSGLPTIVRGWVKQQRNGATWDKARMDDEYIKAKAFYYASCVEPVSVAEYVQWTKSRKEALQPACPYAHMWQNKKRTGGESDEAVSGSTFVVAEEAVITGAVSITFSAPTSNNLFTVSRLKELCREHIKSEANERATSRVLRPVSTTFINDSRNVKMSSTGLALAETADQVQEEKHLLASLDNVADAYYNLLLSSFQLQKTTVTVFDAAIPSNAPYIALWHGFVRVITEDTYLDLGLELSYAPIPPLLLLSLCRPRMQGKQPLPAGTELYLALAPSASVRLRGPELLRLGLADIFVPDARLNEAITGIKRMAMCPQPDTATAIQLVLAAYHSYPGPDRLGVWEKEIQQTFGAAKSLNELKSKLKELDNRWSNTILDHWSTLPPTLVEAVFQAVNACSEMDPAKVLAFERQLNHQWRRTEDFEKWRRNETEWSTENVDFYFEQVKESTTDDAIIYEAPKEEESVAVCPVTGQRSDGAVCPVTGQASSEAKCPVTGQTSSEAKCPVTGQTQTCPVAGQPAA